MTTVGQIEKRTQQRVVKLFREQLGYGYLGERTEREGDRNIEEAPLRALLKEKQRYDKPLIGQALYLLDKAAAHISGVAQ